MLSLFNRSAKVERFKAVIIGAGEVGFHIAQRLSTENKQVVVIDQNPEALRRLAESLDVQTVLGSGCNPSVLHEAGAKSANIILAVTDSDEVNLVACLFAGAIAPDVAKLARIRNQDYIEYQDIFTRETLHISKIINPEVEVVHAIDRMFVMPAAVDYNEFAGGKLKIVGLRIESGPLVGLQLMRFQEVAQDDGVRVAAIVRAGKVIIPYGTDFIDLGDTVYFIFTGDSLKTVQRITAAESEYVKNVLVIGGGNIGLRLAKHFEEQGYHVKLMEKDEDRCQVLAERLNFTVVLHGDGTSRDVLEEENAGEMDAVIALTGNEETNILICLLARSLGAKRTVTRVNKSAYFPLAKATGIDHCVSPRLAAVNSTLAYIRKGRVLSSVSIEDNEAEVLEAEALADSSIVNMPLKDLEFPKGATLLAVVRDGAVIIPKGDTIIMPTDRILILAKRESLSAVEAVLMVKLRSL